MTVPQTFDFIRHGATHANLAGLRCGGDLDVPLVDLGRQQAIDAARRIRESRLSIGIIVTSALDRARETAAIISDELRNVEVVIEPALAERYLGAWNLRPIESTRVGFDAGETPPGGESNASFARRVAGALDNIVPYLAQRPLVVSSKGVARVMGELLGLPPRPFLANGELTTFDLARFDRRGIPSE